MRTWENINAQTKIKRRPIVTLSRTDHCDRWLRVYAHMWVATLSGAIGKGAQSHDLHWWVPGTWHSCTSVGAPQWYASGKTETLAGWNCEAALLVSGWHINCYGYYWPFVQTSWPRLAPSMASTNAHIPTHMTPTQQQITDPHPGASKTLFEILCFLSSSTCNDPFHSYLLFCPWKPSFKKFVTSGVIGISGLASFQESLIFYPSLLLLNYF